MVHGLSPLTRIIAIGEAMVEMAPRADQTTFKIGFAGDTMNTAWYLRAVLEATDQVEFCSAVGTDPISDQMVAFLKEGRTSGQPICSADQTNPLVSM